VIVTPICAFHDNYIWLLKSEHSNACVVVDPGDASPVLTAFSAQNLQLSGILLTHHHADHVGGVEQLLQHFPVDVYGPKGTSPHLTHLVAEGDLIELPAIDASFHVLELPGHTLDHIAYYGEECLFCADTLFSLGCGRLFEGTAEQMVSSLNKIKQLPVDTALFPAHEYTEANSQFALCVEPDNKALLERQAEVREKRSENQPTLPVLLEMELKTNPFLRCDQIKVLQSAEQYVGHDLRSEVEVFAGIRGWKDEF
jgi:hydroxyacylglutathione hydrolase